MTVVRRGSSGSRTGNGPIDEPSTASTASAPREQPRSVEPGIDELQELRERLDASAGMLAHPRRLLDAVPAAAGVALVVVDRDGRCQIVGGRHQALLTQTYVEGADGCTEVVGSVFDANGVRPLAHDELPSIRASRGEEFDRLHLWLGADPRTRRGFTVSARCLRDGRDRLAGAVLTYRDVDEFSRTQQLHDLFLQSMSHELRTPLASVLGRLELLAERDDLPGDVSGLVGGARRNAARLGSLVADMLEIVEVREGRLAINTCPTDVAQLARGAADAARSAAAASGVSIRYEGPDRLLAALDPDRLRGALDQLVANALKFTDPGGMVVIRAGRREHETTLEVEDTGAGIDEDEIDLVFARFYRGRAAHERAAGGTGIGLWVVRNVVEAHGGHVVARRVFPHGTLFHAVFADQAPTPPQTVDDQWAGSRWRRWSAAAAIDDRGGPVAIGSVDPAARPRAFDDVAAVIWRLLDGPRSVADLLEALTARYNDATPEEGPRDAVQFLSDLAVTGLTKSVEDRTV